MAERDRNRSVGAYIGAVIANAIVFYLVNKVPDWNFRFITDGYTAVLWAMNVSLIVQIAGNALLVFFHPRFLHYLGQVVFNAVSLLATIILASVFPFDFSHVADVLNTVVRIALVIAAVGTSISVLVNVFKTIGSLVRHPDR